MKILREELNAILFQETVRTLLEDASEGCRWSLNELRLLIEREALRLNPLPSPKNKVKPGTAAVKSGGDKEAAKEPEWKIEPPEKNSKIIKKIDPKLAKTLSDELKVLMKKVDPKNKKQRAKAKEQAKNLAVQALKRSKFDKQQIKTMWDDTLSDLGYDALQPVPSPSKPGEKQPSGSNTSDGEKLAQALQGDVSKKLLNAIMKFADELENPKASAAQLKKEPELAQAIATSETKPEAADFSDELYNYVSNVTRSGGLRRNALEDTKDWLSDIKPLLVKTAKQLGWENPEEVPAISQTTNAMKTLRRAAKDLR